MSDGILVLDDDEQVLETLADVLGDLGLPLFRCLDARAALEAVWTLRPRLVITDLMMPRMSGLEMLRRVKEIDPRIQVVVITGYGSVREAVEAIREGAFDFIRKPFNAALIVSVARRALAAASAPGAHDAPNAS